MKMASMKMSPKEVEKMTEPSKMEAPEYPYGLCLHLGEEEIKKLGIGTPKAGSKFMLHAMAEVKSVTVSDRADGQGYASMDIQIEEMALEKPGGMGDRKAASSLYGKE